MFTTGAFKKSTHYIYDILLFFLFFYSSIIILESLFICLFDYALFLGFFPFSIFLSFIS